MKNIRALFCALALGSVGVEGEPANPPRAPRLLLFPAVPPATKASEAMQAELKQLQEEGLASRLKTWNRLPELPAWVFAPDAKTEIAYWGFPPAAMDAFRYATIIAPGHETIVIRTGGFAGVYEIYEQKKRPISQP